MSKRHSTRAARKALKKKRKALKSEWVRESFTVRPSVTEMPPGTIVKTLMDGRGGSIC